MRVRKEEKRREERMEEKLKREWGEAGKKAVGREKEAEK